MVQDRNFRNKTGEFIFIFCTTVPDLWEVCMTISPRPGQRDSKQRRNQEIMVEESGREDGVGSCIHETQPCTVFKAQWCKWTNIKNVSSFQWSLCVKAPPLPPQSFFGPPSSQPSTLSCHRQCKWLLSPQRQGTPSPFWTLFICYLHSRSPIQQQYLQISAARKWLNHTVSH